MAENHAVLTPADDEVATFRRFNRLYTRTIGTLGEGLLDSPYSLTEARILYELATRQEVTAKEIACELSLDAGYLSRILRKFEDAGLILKETSATDARQTQLTLTHRGKAAFAELNQLSNKQARELLDHLSPSLLTRPDTIPRQRRERNGHALATSTTARANASGASCGRL